LALKKCRAGVNSGTDFYNQLFRQVAANTKNTKAKAQQQTKYLFFLSIFFKAGFRKSSQTYGVTEK